MHVFAVLLLALAASTNAAELRGHVVGVKDGDTIVVLDAERRQHIVRLAGIDAPEKRQAFGTVSKQHLSSLMFDRDVIVDWRKLDRYARIVGRVVVNGQDANLGQVDAGLAWHYKRFQGEQRPQDRLRYAAAEASAKEARRGLWRDLEPVAPWDWRKGSAVGTFDK